jgi:hypothetical protein
MQLAVFGWATVALCSYFESAAYTQSQGATAEAFADIALACAPAITAEIAGSVARLEQHDHTGDQASIDIYVSQSTTAAVEASAAGTRTTLVDASLDYLRSAADAGLGTSEISVLYELASADGGVTKGGAA